MGARASRQEERLAEVERLHLRHESPAAIARTLGCSTAQISRDMAVLRQRWRAPLERSSQDLKAEELAGLGELSRTLFAGYESSRLPRETTFTEKRLGQVEGSRATVRREARGGNPRFLEGILRVEELRAKLLGLDAPERCTASVEVEEFQSEKDAMKEVWRLLGSPSPWSLSDHPVDPDKLPPRFPGTPPDPSRPDAFKRLFGFTYEELSEQEPET